MRRYRYKNGVNKVRCDRSGMIFGSDEMVYEWNGSLVHRDFLETRSPQERPPAPSQTTTPQNVRTENITYISTYGVGKWRVGRTFVVVPDSAAVTATPVAFDYWYSTVWPTKITP